MTGTITAIFTAPAKHHEQISTEAVQVKTGKGIVGDRFFGLRKSQPGRNLTLIAIESINEFNRIHQQEIPLHATRRNIITQGIHLPELIGLQFRIGGVLCQGVELCEPCVVMARHFPEGALSQAEIIRAFVNNGGIRAAVLTDGIIRLHDEIYLVYPDNSGN